MTTRRPCVPYVLLSLKGIVETQDSATHFTSASMGSFWAREAAKLGWLTPQEGSWRSTIEGQRVYWVSRLAALRGTGNPLTWHWDDVLHLA